MIGSLQWSPKCRKVWGKEWLNTQLSFSLSWNKFWYYLNFHASFCSSLHCPLYVLICFLHVILLYLIWFDYQSVWVFICSFIHACILFICFDLFLKHLLVWCFAVVRRDYKQKEELLTLFCNTYNFSECCSRRDQPGPLTHNNSHLPLWPTFYDISILPRQ